MGIISDLRDRFITAPVAKKIGEELAKAQKSNGEPNNEIQRWAQPMGYNDALFQKRKPGARVTYEQLRNMATLHDISRACINIRKRQVTQLEWDIMPIDDAAGDVHDKELPLIKAYFSTIGGYNTKIRKLLEMMIEDFLVIDAVVLERRRTRGGALLGLIAADPTTIKIRVDENGLTPQPPDIAYEQWILGKLVGEFTADQLIYEMLNPKTDTPYGFSVIEGLILTIEEAMRSRLFSLAYFTDGTTPDGFYEVPATWTIAQIKEYQNHFDSMTGGDPRNQHKVKFMPSTGGKGWQPAKEFDYAGLQPYNDWLLRITCSMFGVAPVELGFTDGVNRSNGEEQTEIVKRNSIRPMAHAIEELFNEILWREQLAICDETGQCVEVIGPFPDLRFGFSDLDNKDEFVDAQVTEKMVAIGAISVDEWRKDKGLEPIGLGPYIQSSTGPILVSDILAGNLPTGPIAPAGPQGAENDPDLQDQEDALNTGPQTELKRWEKKAITDLKSGRAFRPFYSDILDEYTKVHLAHDLIKCTDKEQVRNLFTTYRKSLEEGISYDAERLLKKLDQLAAA